MSGRTSLIDRALEVASAAGIPTALVDRSRFGGFGPDFDRDAYTVAVTGVLVAADVDVVVMADTDIFDNRFWVRLGSPSMVKLVVEGKTQPPLSGTNQVPRLLPPIMVASRSGTLV